MRNAPLGIGEQIVITGSASCSPVELVNKDDLRLDHQVPVRRGDDSIFKFNENDGRIHACSMK